MSDFDLMMQKKKEEMRRNRRKRKDADMINDNDDLIADMITKMKEAAEVCPTPFDLKNWDAFIHKNTFFTVSSLRKGTANRALEQEILILAEMFC